jgi:tetratricopeptide (TPR) repeat protein
LHVPLVIRAPKHGKDLRVDGNVSLVDIVPTVLELLGLKTPAQVDGVSLTSSLESGAAPARANPIYAESLEASTYDCGELHGVVDAQWKHILAPKQELYDLASDSNEQRNAIEQQPQVAHQLRSRLEAMLKVMESKTPKGAGPSVDREAVKRLQSLGYVGGGAAPGAAAFDPAREDPKEFLTIYERLLKADGMVRSSHREEALKELLEIVRERPGLAAAHFNLAVLLQEMGKSGEASDRFAEALRLRPDYREAHVKLGTLLQMAGKLPEAIDHYEQALRGQPDDADVLCNLGSALQQMGRLPEAIAHYEQCLRVRPDDADAHYNLGNALQQMGNLPEAIAHYEQCLLIRPDYARVNSGISALVAAREAVNTIESLEQTLVAFPQDCEAHVKLGNVLRKTGRVPDAIIRYEQALRIKPESVEAHYNLAVALVQAGKLSDAVGHYTEAVRVNPSFLPGLNNLAWIRATSDDPQLRDGAEAVRLAERACQLTGRKQFPPLDILAAAHAEAGHFAEAAATAQEAVDLAKAANQTNIAAVIESHMAMYRAGKPYRQAPRTQ